MANKKRLIDANALMEAARNSTASKTVKHAICIFAEIAPIVDAVEVVHGRWEQIGEADYRCPVCGFRFTSCDPIEMFEYCRCGTKMDGDGNA